MNSKNALDSPLMAFHLTRMVNSSQARELEFGGTFTFGAVNNTLFTGDIDYQSIPSDAPGYWIIPVAGQIISCRSFDTFSNCAIQVLLYRVNRSVCHRDLLLGLRLTLGQLVSQVPLTS